MWFTDNQIFPHIFKKPTVKLVKYWGGGEEGERKERAPITIHAPYCHLLFT